MVLGVLCIKNIHRGCAWGFLGTHNPGDCSARAEGKAKAAPGAVGSQGIPALPSPSPSVAAQSHHPAAPNRFCLQGRYKNNQQLQFPEPAGRGSTQPWPQQPETPLGESFAGLPFKALMSLREGFFCLVLATAALCEQHQNLLKLSSSSAWLSVQDPEGQGHNNHQVSKLN